MDDLAEMLNSVLNDPEQMKKIQSILGDGNFDFSSLGDILSSGKEENTSQDTQEDTQSNGFDIGMLLKAQKIFSSMSQKDDKNVELLKALKKHFGEERRKKVDTAIKIMQVIKLLPLIKESGLFGGESHEK